MLAGSSQWWCQLALLPDCQHNSSGCVQVHRRARQAVAGMLRGVPQCAADAAEEPKICHHQAGCGNPVVLFKPDTLYVSESKPDTLQYLEQQP